ncbi:MAG: hypothetical protein HS116_26805 [Planctomycetes bacterium]|nr:hypothetical protein [Planctomycetota bacterium]
MNRTSMRAVAAFGGVLIAVILSGCGGGDLPKTADGKPDWHLMLNVDGVETKIPAHRLAVFLTDDEEYSEVFELDGPGLMLAGACPLESRVGYGEKWSNIFGKSYTIQATGGGDRGEPKNSVFTLPGGKTQNVKGGTLTFEKVTGKYTGQDGDMTIWGTIKIELEGSKTLEGTFCVNCMTWG